MPPPTSNQTIGGIYNGTLTICEVTGCLPHDYLLVVSEQGEYLGLGLAFASLPIVGLLDVTGSQFDGSRNVYIPGPDPVSFGYPPTGPPQVATGNASRGIRGSFVAGQSIEADYFHVSQLSDTQFVGTYDLQYDQDSSLQRISGMYSADDGAGLSLTYVIDDSGNVTGSDSTGCTVSGSVELIDRNKNVYRTNLAFSACGANGADGSGYTGLAILRTSQTSTQESLYLYATDELKIVVMELPKI